MYQRWFAAYWSGLTQSIFIADIDEHEEALYLSWEPEPSPKNIQIW